MARNGKHSKSIEAYFLENPSKVTSVAKLMTVAKCTKPQVSSSISYLNKKWRDGTGGLHITTIQRGQTGGDSPEENADVPESHRTVDRTDLRRATAKLDNPGQDALAKWMGAEIIGVPDTEPAVVLKVIGTLREDGGGV